LQEHKPEQKEIRAREQAGRTQWRACGKGFYLLISWANRGSKVALNKTDGQKRG